MKARPIAPGINHPMKRMMHLAGRAWHFISCNVPGEHYVMRSTVDVPKFFKKAQDHLSKKQGDLKVVLRDIEGCFPNMPTMAIDQACKDITTQLRSLGHEGVWVPRRGKKKPCEWEVRHTMHESYVWFPFVDLLQIMDFSLHHALVRMPNGEILRQCKGIPMGGPLSPGATIITCAWMEQEFMHGLHDDDKDCFSAKRYMDDVILVCKECEGWDHEHFMQDMTSNCYMPPLNLEPSKDGVFLETEFLIKNNKIVHRLN